MPAKRKEYPNAVEMYYAGNSIEDIASLFSVTRQSMHKWLRRRDVIFRPNMRFGEENVFYRGGARQCHRARQLVILAVEKGELVAPNCCSECGEIGRVEGHHDDYNHPLQVRWLCHMCHYGWHKVNVPIKCNNPKPAMTRSELCSLGGKSSWANMNAEERNTKMKTVRSKKR